MTKSLLNKRLFCDKKFIKQRIVCDRKAESTCTVAVVLIVLLWITGYFVV